MKTLGSLTRHKFKCICALLLLWIPTHAHAAQTDVSSARTAAHAPACPTTGREKELFEAIWQRESKRVEALLAAGVNPNARAEINYESREDNEMSCATALMHAARLSDLKTFQALLAAKADVNARDSSGRLVWAYAVGYYTIRQFQPTLLQDEMNARFHISKALLAAGAPLNASDEGGWSETALFHAVDAGILTGDLRVLNALLNAGALVKVKGTSILAYAISQAFRAESGVRIDDKAPEADKVIEALLAARADVNAHRKGFTPLRIQASGARLAGTTKRLKILLAAGADVNAQDTDGQTALLAAIKPYEGWVEREAPERNPADALRDQVEVIKLLLAAGADPDQKDNNGSALHAVVSAYNIYKLAKHPAETEAIFKALIAAGGDPNARGYMGQTVLLKALSEIFTDTYLREVEEDKLRLLKILIAAGADVNAPDTQGQTALKVAILKHSDNVVQELLAGGANVNVRDKDGATALLIIAAGGVRLAVARLLIKAGADVNIPNKKGQTPLMEAITSSLRAYAPIEYRKDEEIVHLLIEAKADLNAKNDEGDTALIIAARRYGSAGGREDYNYVGGSVLSALIAAGAEVKTVNRSGESALTIMAMKSGTDSLPLIRALLAAARRDGARGYPRAADLLAAIRRAAGRSRADIVQELITAGADVNVMDESGRPALMVAVSESGNAAVVRALLAAGARVNARDKNSDTALIAAAREYLPGGDEFIKKALRRDTEVIRALLAAGADTNARNKDGQTALALAEKSANKNVIDLLKAAGAHP